MTPHPEFAAFVAHLRAAPHDGVGWLALADWLDEHADPRAEFVRLSVALTTGQIPVEAWEITRDKLKRFTDCDVTHPGAMGGLTDLMVSYRARFPVRFRVTDAAPLGDSPFGTDAQTIAVGYLEAGELGPEAVFRVPHRIELGPFRVDRVAYLLPVAFRTYQSVLGGAVAGRPPLGFGIVFPGHLDIPRGTTIEPALPPEESR